MMEDNTVEVAIDGVLDLHMFQPREVKDLLPYYLSLCQEKDIYDVRIIHGKGSGALRDMVHSLLAKNPNVLRFKLAGVDGGSWGATLVTLRQ